MSSSDQKRPWVLAYVVLTMKSSQLSFVGIQLDPKVLFELPFTKKGGSFKKEVGKVDIP